MLGGTKEIRISRANLRPERPVQIARNLSHLFPSLGTEGWSSQRVPETVKETFLPRTMGSGLMTTLLRDRVPSPQEDQVAMAEVARTATRRRMAIFIGEEGCRAKGDNARCGRQPCLVDQ